MTILLPAIAAFLLVAVLTPLAREMARRRGHLDVPTERSSHTVPTPKTGGYAIAIGMGAALLLSHAYRDRGLLFMMAGLSCLILLALVDERRRADQKFRLAIQILVALAVSSFGSMLLDGVDIPLAGRLSLASFAIPATLLWIVGETNAYNFMDGLNGMAAMEAVVCGSALALLLLRAGDVGAAAMALAAAGAAAGFLPWNLTGTIFMGDTGSTTFGFIFGVLVVRAAGEGVSFIAAALPLAPFLFDTLVTLLRRIVRGERFLSAHRSHFYQRLNQRGWPHAAVSTLWGALATVCAVISLHYDRMPPAGQWMSLAAIIGMHTVVFAAIVVRFGSRAEA